MENNVENFINETEMMLNGLRGCRLDLPYEHPINIVALSEVSHESFVMPPIPQQYCGDKSENIACRDIYLSGAFDDTWYRKTYQDMKSTTIDPIWHYVMHGASEGRNPSEWFSTTYYLNANPDIVDDVFNPLHHYILHGWKEGRNVNGLHTENGYMKHITLAWNTCGDIDIIQSIHDRYVEDAHIATVKASRYAGFGLFCMEHGLWPHAEEAFKNALLLQQDSVEHLNLLALCLRRQSKWWQEINILEQATALVDYHADWWFRLGEAREAMERWNTAAEAYQKAIALDGQWADWHYRLGLCFERNALPRPASEAYAKAVSLEMKLNAKELGIGVFHEKRGYWNDALRAYENHLRENLPGTAELHAKLAVAYHRCYDMEKAAAANFNVLAVAQEDNTKMRADAYYRMGITNERMGKLDLAARAYGCSLEIAPNNYRRYRQGYVLAKMERYKEASDAYLKIFATVSPAVLSQEIEGESIDSISESTQLSLKMAHEAIAQYTTELCQDTTKTELYFLKGAAHEIIGDMTGAADSYAAGMARQSNHWPEGWYRLGKALYACGRFAEACDAFANIEILRKPYWVDRGSYKKSTWFKRCADYIEYCEHLPVATKTVLYENLHGVGVGDSPQAIFASMLNDPAYVDWTHVWSLESFESIPTYLRALPNVIFVRRESDVFLRYMATAKMCINNVTFPEYFSRRSEQLYLNTWHGTPLKTLGKDIKDDPLGYNNATRNLFHCTHMIHPNKYTEEIMFSSYNVKHLFKGLSAVTGYPRMDQTLNYSASDKESLRKKFGIPEGNKILLYAPTWRGSLAANHCVETHIDFINDVLKECASLSGYSIIFRGHHLLERYVNGMPDCIITPQSIPSNDIIAISDVMITDYSSIAFDFMATGRPIIYYCHDIEDYAASRGLYTNPQEMPGAFCRNPSELKIALLGLKTWKLDDFYRSAQSKFCSYDDGSATQRTITLLNTSPAPSIHCNQAKKRILFYTDLIPNGIGMSFLSLCNSLDKNKYDVSILVNKGLILNTPGAMQLLQQVDPEFRIFPFNSVYCQSIEELHVRNQLYNSGADYESEFCSSMLSNVYKREFKRLFGDTEFDVLIDYVGYSCHQSELFAFAPCKNKIIYLHNDMQAEFKNRFNYLKRIFRVYRHYNKMVSVSASINQINKSYLSTEYSVDPNKFITVPNMQRPDYVQQAAQEPLETGDEKIFTQPCKHFITLGRLSPEKNHAMLLDAFAALHGRYPNTRLLILGQGPLKQQLQIQIEHLGLSDCAFLLGHKHNPYPYLSRSDCFVFPSKYEGQGVVLYEAFALDIPVIATNIPTSTEVLKNGRYGLLVEQTPESLMRGMEAFLLGKVPKPNFDFTAYQANAMQAFEAIL